MPNLRILYDNVVDRAASLAADSTAVGGTLVASNLQTDIKTDIHRSNAATTVVYTLTWSAAQTFNMAALAFANLTAAATIKAQVFTNTGDVSPALDTGAVVACGYTPYLPQGAAIGVNQFPYGGFTYGRVYFAATPGKKLVITVADAGNAAGYIEAGRLIAGQYWSPAYNAGYGPQLSLATNTQSKRDGAGNLRAEIRPKSRGLRVNLERLVSAADRDTIYSILRGNGALPVFFSLYPENADAALEQEHQIWGRLKDSSISLPSVGLFTAPLEIEEI